MFSLLLSGALLSAYVPTEKPWLDIQANSEQRQPVYLGANPLEIEVLGKQTKDLAIPVELPIELKKLAEKVALRLGPFEFEAWPVQDEEGQRTWAFARFRKDESSPWIWIRRNQKTSKLFPEIYFPSVLYPSNPKHFKLIFEDVFELQKFKMNLYVKPEFGNCVWTANGKPTEAWLPLGERVSRQKGLAHKVCYSLPQPSRWNGKPLTFVLKVQNKKVIWTPAVEKKIEGKELQTALPFRPLIAAWKDVELAKTYQQDVTYLSTHFERKNSLDSKHQLNEVIAYLMFRYEEMGLTDFKIQDIPTALVPQSNFIAKIKGSLAAPFNKPVLMADHIDTAFSEDLFLPDGPKGKMGILKSAPGADDNAGATAALLAAARVLKNSKHLHDIWFIHLVGEEYPADDLGARFFVSTLLKTKQEISGLVLLDMIGYTAKIKNEKGEEILDPLFQINAGESQESLKIGQIAMEAAKLHAKPYLPYLRERFDEKSYLYNTDGVIFSDSGFPVVLFNEHMNGAEKNQAVDSRRPDNKPDWLVNRPDYHASTDDVAHMNFAYAVAITKAAIETVAQLANAQ